MRKKVIKFLADAPPEKRFLVNGGLVLKNLKDLRDAMATRLISNEQFEHHVNHEKNDFARWIEDVFEDRKCAEKLRKAKTKKGFLGAVERILTRYS